MNTIPLYDMGPLQRGLSSLHLDEEECLGFDVFVAELELAVGTSKDRKPDGVALLDILQKLNVSLDRADRTVLKQQQKRCEAVIMDILLKGVSSKIRYLMFICISKLYTTGDMLPMFSRVNYLQGQLAEKERLSSEVARVGVLECLAYLSLHHGKYLASSAVESVSLAAKMLGGLSVFQAGYTLAEKSAALKLVAAVVEGLNPMDRSALAVQGEAWRLYEKTSKDKNSEDLRAASASILTAIAKVGGGILWTNGGSGYEDAIKYSLSGLEDPSSEVREMYCTALGELAACVRQDAVRSAMEGEKKPVRKQQLEKLVTSALQQCLVNPFSEAVSRGAWDVCSCLALAWLRYLSALARGHYMDSEGFIDLAVQAVQMMDLCARQKPGPSTEAVDIGSCLDAGEIPHIQACASYILQVGILPQLGESGQRKLLDRLASVAGTATTVPTIIVSLEGVGVLLETLGEVADEAAQKLHHLLVARQCHPSAPVRYQAAAVLSSLALAQPSSASQLLSAELEALEDRAQQLSAVAGTLSAKTFKELTGVLAGSPRLTRDANPVRTAMDAVHGHALSVASLLVASSRLPLGIPSRLLFSVFVIAKRLIHQPCSPFPATRAVEREAGYIIVGAICVALHPDMLRERQEELHSMWEVALGPAVKETFDEKNYLKPGSEVDLAAQLWWRTAALEALTAYILAVVGHRLVDDVETAVAKIAGLLSPLLEAVSANALMQEPHKAWKADAPPSVKLAAASAAQLQMQLLEVYFYLPSLQKFPQDHNTLLVLCTRPLQCHSGAGSLRGNSDYLMQSLTQVTLRPMLHMQDVMLGPWLPGPEVLEDELRAFCGRAGGPLPPVWELGLTFTRGFPRRSLLGTKIHAGTQWEARLRVRGGPYRQSQGLTARLVEVQLWVLGKLMAVLGPSYQGMVLDALMNAVKSREPVVKKDKEQVRSRPCVSVAVCIAALAGLGPLARKGRTSGGGGEAIAEKVLQLVALVLEDTYGEVVLLRAAAEMVAAACCLTSDGFTLAQVRTLCAELAESIDHNGDLDTRAALILAVGCIYRAKGAICLQPMIMSSVEQVIAAASRPAGRVHLWALHSLVLMANAAGLPYTAHVRTCLQIAQELVVSSFGDHPLVKPAAARLANATVAVLGPEFKLGSACYRMCKMLVTDITPEGSITDSARDGPWSVEMTWAALENVLFAQQIILFAPRAVPAKKHIPLLQATLSSKRGALRRVAAATLRHLAERDAQSVLSQQVEGSLFMALDCEGDYQIAGQLQATLVTLMKSGVRDNPGYWLRLLGEVALATSRGGGQGYMEDVAGALQADTADDDDAGPPSVPQTSAPSMTNGLGHPGSAKKKGAMTTPRLRTRLFAAECLLQIFASVGSDPRHRDPRARNPPASAAGSRRNTAEPIGPMRSSSMEVGGVAGSPILVASLDPGMDATCSGGEDFLVDHLQSLIDLGFKLSTGDMEALRPAGVLLLREVIAFFGDVADPEVAGSNVLEQYQAQFVSVLRTALAPGGAPMLSVSGGSLSTMFLETGLAAGDAVVMRRLIDLLVAPLAQWTQLSYAMYAEWVGVQARLALLQAHAQCACIAQNGGDEVCVRLVQQSQAPFKEVLLVLWIALLQDYAVLFSQPHQVLEHYRSALFGDASPALVDVLKGSYEEAVPVVLEAVCTQGLDRTAVIDNKGAAGDNPLTQPSLQQDWQDFLLQVATSDPAALSKPWIHQQLASRAWPMYTALMDILFLNLDHTIPQLASSLAAVTPSSLVEGGDKVLAEVFVGCRRLECGMRSLRSVLGQDLLTQNVCTEQRLRVAMRKLLSIIQQVLLPIQHLIVSVSTEPENGSRSPCTTLLLATVKSLTAIIVDVVDTLISHIGSENLEEDSVMPQLMLDTMKATVDVLVCEDVRDSLDTREGTTGSMLPSTTGHERSSSIARQSSNLSDTPRYTPPCLPSTSQDWEESTLLGVVHACHQLMMRYHTPFSAVEVQLSHLTLRLLLVSGPGQVLTAAQGLMAECLEKVAPGDSKPSGQTSFDREMARPLLAGLTIELATAAAVLMDQLKLSARAEHARRVSINNEDVGQKTKQQGRLLAIISSMLQVASRLQGEDAAESEVLLKGRPSSSGGPAQTSGREFALWVLRMGVGPEVSPSISSKVLEAVRVYVQEAAGGDPGSGKSRLAAACLAVVGPRASLQVHQHLREQSPLEGDSLAAAIESLKLLLVSATSLLTSAQQQEAVMKVLVPLLVEVSAPPEGLPVTPVLRDMALRLITAMPSSSAGASFRTVVAALPAESKQRLQAALKGTGGAAPDPNTPGAPGSSLQPKKPTIELKMSFTLPKPS